MDYIEPAEFAGLGLLAVAFVSVSSADVGMRKLGYETLGRFKNALEVIFFACILDLHEFVFLGKRNYHLTGKRENYYIS